MIYIKELLMFQLLKLGKNYYILVSINEDHLDDEDFTQRIIEYVIKKITEDDRFKNLNFNNKDDKNIIKDY